MNRDTFKHITAEVITDIMDDMEKEGLSGMSLVVTTMTMSMFASKLEEKLFDESDSLEIERGALIMDNSFTPAVMSECNVSYDNSDMIYTVTFQSKDHEKAVIKMYSSCVHDFLTATMGF